MTRAKSEITLKISELPSAKPAPDKKVEVIVRDQNEIPFLVRLNAKSWRKAEQATKQYPIWVGSISGKLARTSQGLELHEAGIQIFAKNAQPASESPEPPTPS